MKDAQNMSFLNRNRQSIIKYVGNINMFYNLNTAPDHDTTLTLSHIIGNMKM